MCKLASAAVTARAWFQQRVCSADVCVPVYTSGRGLCVHVCMQLSVCQVPLRDG